jgi:hypothetical protein
MNDDFPGVRNIAGLFGRSKFTAGRIPNAIRSLPADTLSWRMALDPEIWKGD